MYLTALQSSPTSVEVGTCLQNISNTRFFFQTFLIFALVIVVNQGGGVTAEDETKVDQVAEEAKNGAVTIIDSPKYITKLPGPPPTKPDVQTHRPEQRPPSKPPLFPDKPKQSIFGDIPRSYFGQFQKYPPPRIYSKPLMKYPNSIYQFPKVIPLTPHHQNFFVKSRPLQYVGVASTYQPTLTKTPNTPKFSIPVQTINGIRTDTVRPHKVPTKPANNTNPTVNTTTSTTTTTTEKTTTAKLLRTKRIWPKKVQKLNITSNATDSKNGTKTIIENYSANANEVDIDTSASHHRVRYVSRNSTTTSKPTKRVYRPVVRAPKHKSTTTPLPLDLNFTHIGENDWIPIVPSHYPKLHRTVKANKPISWRSDVVVDSKVVNQTPMNRRSDIYADAPMATDQEMMYMQSFGLVPMPTAQTAAMNRKKTVYFNQKRPSHPHYSSYSTSPVHSPYMYGDLQTEESHHKPRYVTKIKHHHHHHHHKYVKTVEKPVKVPYKVEVPKPYPVQVEKKVPVPVEKIKFVDKPVPYPVTVEKKVPYPIKVPHPVPVKVVEKEYVPKPYPIVHHVPVVKHVQVKVPVPQPYPVEKRVPYPVEVKVHIPVDRPVPVAVPVEKQVPYPVHVKVFVPQPYPVETKVPYPVHIKEPVEVIKHVKVPVPQPYPVEVKVPYPVEKRVPYPVEVEKKVPVPFEVLVPQRVEVEKRVPVYVPRPYPVEKRVPYPVKVPYAVKVPVKVPFEVPVYIHHPYQMFEYDDVSPSATPESSTGHHTVTVHGNPAFTSGFQSRSDDDVTTQTVTTTS